MRTISRLIPMILVLLALAMPAHAADPIKVLLITGQNNHKWAETTPVIKAMLEKTGRFQVDELISPPKGAPADAWNGFQPDFNAYPVVFVNYNDFGKGDQWPAGVQKALEAYMAAGGGMVIFHAANNAFPKWPEWNKMIGLNWQPNSFGDGIKIEDGKVVRIPQGTGNGAGHGPQHAYECRLLNPQHPIVQGMPERWMHAKDELYHGQRGPALNMDVLVYGFDDPAATEGRGSGNNEPLVYTVTYGQGRVFVNLMGHDASSTDQPDMAALLTRGTEWAATGNVTLPLPAGFGQ